ncbi:hypothetical protein [Williamsia sp. M5A3_1d]
MTDLTVFLGSSAVGAAVLDALRDLSAGGLTDRFYWVDSGDVVSSSVVAQEVDAGTARRVDLADIIASRNHARTRLCVVVPLVAGAMAPADSAIGFVDDLLATSAGAASMTRVRAIVARSGSPAATSIAVEGWHNTLIAAEDARGPNAGRVVLSDTSDVVAVGRHTAPAIASIVGLWGDIADGPFDAELAAPGQVIRVCRSFYRRFDTDDAESALRRAVFDTGNTLPVPRGSAVGSVRHVDDPALAADQMARALWTKHRAVLRSARIAPTTTAPEKIGVWAAIRMLASFLVAAFKNAPGQWYASIVRRSSTRAAQLVHTTVYGTGDSAYSVVVNGIDATGSPADLDQIGAAASRMDDALSEVAGDRTHSALPDLGPVWEDFVGGAMTLADGGERVQGMPPIQIGAQRGVLRSVSDCVASAEEKFDIAGPVAAVVGSTSIGANEGHRLTDLANRLRAAEADPMVGVAARATFEELRKWAARHSASYGARVGSILLGEITACRREIQGLLARIATGAAHGDPGAEAQNRQRALARLLQIVSVVFAVVVATFVVLAGIRIVNPLVGAGLAVATLVVWMITVVITFVRGQRDLFQELSRRQADEAQSEADKANLRAAVRDLRRMAFAHGQYQSWATVVGEVLRRPFGVHDDTENMSPLIGYGLPLSTKFAVAHPDQDVVADAGLHYRRELFTVGWLGSVWQECLVSAGRGIGAVGQDVRENPRLIYSEPGVGSGSALDLFARRIVDEAVTDEGSEALWSKVVASLTSPGSAVAATLIQRVTTVTDGALQESSIEDFMAGIDSEDHGVQYFDDALFSDVAVAAGRNRIATTFRRVVRTGLGSVGVATQLSEALPEFDFRFVTTDQSATPRRGGVGASAADDPFEESSTSPSTPAGVEAPGAGYVF